jgi:Na+/melibiose symporter-like transporter
VGAFFFQTGALVYFFHYYVGNNDLTAIVAGISTFVPLLGTLTVPLLASRMKKRHVYLWRARLTSWYGHDDGGRR